MSFGDLRHRLVHRLHWQLGDVVSGWSGDALWIAFRCRHCGEVTGAHIAVHRYGSTVLSKQSLSPPTEWHDDAGTQDHR